MNSDPARSAIGTSSQPLNIMMLSPFFAVAAIAAAGPRDLARDGSAPDLGARHLGPDPLSRPALGRPTDRRAGPSYHADLTGLGSICRKSGNRFSVRKCDRQKMLERFLSVGTETILAIDLPRAVRVECHLSGPQRCSFDRAARARHCSRAKRRNAGRGDRRCFRARRDCRPKSGRHQGDRGRPVRGPHQRCRQRPLEAMPGSCSTCCSATPRCTTMSCCMTSSFRPN